MLAKPNGCDVSARTPIAGQLMLTGGKAQLHRTHRHKVSFATETTNNPFNSMPQRKFRPAPNASPSWTSTAMSAAFSSTACAPKRRRPFVCGNRKAAQRKMIYESISPHAGFHRVDLGRSPCKPKNPRRAAVASAATNPDFICRSRGVVQTIAPDWPQGPPSNLRKSRLHGAR